ncbi:unnamed protein product, partial [Ixodes pacificus]
NVTDSWRSFKRRLNLYLPTCYRIRARLSHFTTGNVDYTISLTRAELLKSIQRFAAGFQALGITIGDRVCVHVKNSVENFIAVQGIIFTGAAVILAKTSLTE